MRGTSRLLVLSFAGATALGAQPMSRPPRDTTDVVVQNDRTEPVTVYLETATGEFRLGRVGPLGTADLVVPRWLVGSGAAVDIFVHPRRGFDEDTGELEVRRGDRVGVIVPARDARHAHSVPPAR